MFDLSSIPDLDEYLARVKRGRAGKYPLPEMQVGQKFDVSKRHEGGARSAIRHFCRNNPGRKFITHTVGDTLEIVRIA